MFKMIADIIDVNHSVLSGAMDIIVVKDDEKVMVSSPFHVRFGTLKILKTKEKTVNIYVNNKKTDLSMRLSSSGHAYFVRESKEFKESVTNYKESEAKIIKSEFKIEEVKIENNFNIDAELKMNSRNECEMKSPPNSPDKKNSIELQIDEEFELVEDIKKEDYEHAHKVPSFKVHESGILPHNDNRITTPVPSNIKTDTNSLSHLNSIELSLCHKELISNPDKAEEIFKKYIVRKQDFMSNPWKILNHPNLLICYADKLYTYNAAIPLLMSLLVYKEEPPITVINQLLENKSIFDFLRSKKPNINSIKLHHDYSDEGVNKESKKLTKNYTQKKTKSLTPTPEELKMLGLVEGKNEITFACYSALSGRQVLKAEIYLWNSNNKIVISDVDGTITRSDVLGHIMPIVGKDWSHQGIVELYNNIEKNGYKFIYLSARSICQSMATKNYLQNLDQNNKKLPQGPVILSPDGLITSFKREVIDKRPQDFKIASLTEIKHLFGNNLTPFFSGFGNRSTDATAYRTVGIELFRIFIVNEKGNLTQLNNSCQKSYSLLNQIVDDVFPKLNEKEKEIKNN